MTKLFATDLHGTIVDSKIGFGHAINAALEQMSKESVESQIVEELLGKPWGDCYRVLFTNAPEEEVARFVSIVRELGREYVPKHEKLIPHAYDVLTEMRRRGYNTAVVSIMPNKGIDSTLRRHVIRDLFDGILGIEVAQEMGGYDVGELKGRLLRDYIRETGADEVIMGGDREEDVTAGLIVGATTFYFNREGKKSERATYSIRNLTELLSKGLSKKTF